MPSAAIMTNHQIISGRAPIHGSRSPRGAAIDGAVVVTATLTGVDAVGLRVTTLGLTVQVES